MAQRKKPNKQDSRKKPESLRAIYARIKREFSAADLLMTTCLRQLRGTDLVARYPVLPPYLARCEARPAFKKALAEQMAPYASLASYVVEN